MCWKPMCLQHHELLDMLIPQLHPIIPTFHFKHKKKVE